MSMDCCRRTGPRSRRSCEGVESTRKLKFDHPGLATTAIAVGRAAHHPERHRRNRRPCGRDRGRTGCGDCHLHRRSSGACEILHRPVAGIFPSNGAGLIARARRASATSEVFYLVTGRYPIDDEQTPRELSRSDRRIACLPDRLEQGPQGPAGVVAQGRRGPCSRLGGAQSFRSPRFP